MSAVLSPNTQAILLLTAPLIAGRGVSSPDLLSPGEYKRLARHLHGMQRQPADLLSADAAELMRACQPVIDDSRLQRLSGRGFLLSQAVERWQARAIWVISRADADYPRRLKARLREDAPAVLYGCGDVGLLATGGLAVVGSRHVDDALIEYALDVGRLVARAGRPLVSGGARGIDQAAMRGAAEGGGTVSGVLADSLEKTAMNREHRNLLLDGRLVLISPYDPNAGFNVGHAMQRNKLIYALAEAALVVSSDLEKGGTWGGATEQLDKLRLVPVYVRSTGELSAGLAALRHKGALPWPNPQDVEALEAVFDVAVTPAPQSALLPFSEDGPNDTLPALDAGNERLAPAFAVPDDPPVAQAAEASPAVTPASETKSDAANPVAPTETTPAEALFAAVREAIRHLKAPMNEAEVAAALDVSSAQAKAWLQRLVDEGTLEKRAKPIRYVGKTQGWLLRDDARHDRLQ